MSDHIYDDDPRMTIYYELKEHAKKTPGFNSRFLYGIELQLDRNGRISMGQYRTLQEIYENRHM